MLGTLGRLAIPLMILRVPSLPRVKNPPILKDRRFGFPGEPAVQLLAHISARPALSRVPRVSIPFLNPSPTPGQLLGNAYPAATSVGDRSP